MDDHLDNPNIAEDKSRFDNAEANILITSRDSTILYANRGVADTTGFSPPEIIGKRPQDLWGGHMEKSFYEHMWHLINSKRPFTGDVRNIRKSGEAYVDSLHVAPILDAVGNVKYFIEISPAHGTVQGQPGLREEFIDTFANQSPQDESLIRCMFRMLQLPQPSVLPEKELSVFVEHTLVKPMEALYQHRVDDRVLILDAQKNSAVFGKLYEKYFDKIKKHFLSRLHEEGLADDLAQETFLQAFKSLPQFTVSNASYLTYLQHIAHNLLISHYRKAKMTVLDDAFLATIPAAPIDYASLWDIEALWRVVATLRPIEQEVLRLKYQDDLAIRDIATRLRKSENAIKLALSRARKRVQMGIRPHTG